MKCSRCGFDNFDDAKFCVSCGNEFTTTPKPLNSVENTEVKQINQVYSYKSNTNRMAPYSVKNTSVEIPFYFQMWFIIVLLIFCWPVSFIFLFLRMSKYPDQKKPALIFLSIIIGLVFLSVLIIAFS